MGDKCKLTHTPKSEWDPKVCDHLLSDCICTRVWIILFLASVNWSNANCCGRSFSFHQVVFNHMIRYRGVKVKEKLQTTAQSCTISFSAPTADRSTWAQICAHIRVRVQPARLSNLPHFPAGRIAEIDPVGGDPISLLPVILVRTFGSLHTHTYTHTKQHSAEWWHVQIGQI